MEGGRCFGTRWKPVCCIGSFGWLGLRLIVETVVRKGGGGRGGGLLLSRMIGEAIAAGTAARSNRCILSWDTRLWICRACVRAEAVIHIGASVCAQPPLKSLPGPALACAVAAGGMAERSRKTPDAKVNRVGCSPRRNDRNESFQTLSRRGARLGRSSQDFRGAEGSM